MPYVVYADDFETGELECSELAEAEAVATRCWHPGSIWWVGAAEGERELVAEFGGINHAIDLGRGKNNIIDWKL